MNWDRQSPEYKAYKQEYDRRYRATNPQRTRPATQAVRDYQNRYLKDRPEWAMHKACKAKCKKLGIPFNLEVSDITISTKCPVFGFVMDRSTRERTPSLDRVNPRLGYVKGNVCVISVKANRQKADSTVDDLQKIIDYIQSYKTPLREPSAEEIV